MSKLSDIFKKKCAKIFNKRVYTEVNICMKDSKTGEILHTYPTHYLYEGDKFEMLMSTKRYSIQCSCHHHLLMILNGAKIKQKYIFQKDNLCPRD